MPKYAMIDPTLARPSLVLGWYDADAFDYGDALPPPARRLTLTDAQWAGRLDTPCYDGAGLVAGPPVGPMPPQAGG